jgi:hypothetical protein
MRRYYEAAGGPLGLEMLSFETNVVPAIWGEIGDVNAATSDELRELPPVQLNSPLALEPRRKRNLRPSGLSGGKASWQPWLQRSHLRRCRQGGKSGARPGSARGVCVWMSLVLATCAVIAL